MKVLIIFVVVAMCLLGASLAYFNHLILVGTMRGGIFASYYSEIEAKVLALTNESTSPSERLRVSSDRPLVIPQINCTELDKIVFDGRKHGYNVFISGMKSQYKLVLPQSGAELAVVIFDATLFPENFDRSRLTHQEFRSVTIGDLRVEISWVECENSISAIPIL